MNNKYPLPGELVCRYVYTFEYPWELDRSEYAALSLRTTVEREIYVSFS